MDYQEARKEFVQRWGSLGINWGVNRILGQIHGLLLTSSEPMCADDIMSMLEISRGSVNTNLRILVDWELIEKCHITDNRKEFFTAEKDMWIIFCQIIKQRRKKELDPLMETLETLAVLESSCDHSKELTNVIESIDIFSKKVDKALHQIVKEKPNFLVSTYLRL